MYKRALDSPPTYRSKMNRTSQKNLNVHCFICGDRAIGFNYAVLTCASCKAFFRRNAQHNPVCFLPFLLPCSIKSDPFFSGESALFKRREELRHWSRCDSQVSTMSLGEVFPNGNEKRSHSERRGKTKTNRTHRTK